MGANILWAVDTTVDDQSISPRLLDHMAVEVGLRNLHYLSAAISDTEPAYRTLREAGYKPCAWHKVWQLKNNPPVDKVKGINWRKVKSSDTFSISLLQNRLLSAQEKMITAPVDKKPPIFILVHNNSVCGYAYAFSSLDKVVITPFFDPNLINTARAINALLDQFFSRIHTVYLLQTTNQDWVETQIRKQVYLAVPKKEVLVKFLSVLYEDRILNLNHSKTSRHTDVVSPLTKLSDGEDNI